MLNRLPGAAAAVAAFVLVTVAVPGPIMIDLLGVGLASIGIGMFSEYR